MDIQPGWDGQVHCLALLVYPTTPMLLDALAIAAKYGPDTATATVDNVYHWSESEPLFRPLSMPVDTTSSIFPTIARRNHQP